MVDDVVAVARAWIGTPYQHQASVKGVACDCLGLIRGVWRECHGTEPEAPPPYTPDWGEGGGYEELMEAALRHLVPVCRDQAMLQVDLVVRQKRRLPIAASEYETADGQGVPLAHFRKNSWTSLGRRRWWIVTPASMVIGWAEEDSLPRALARKVAGHAVRALRSNYRFVVEGQFVGRLERRNEENVVDLAPDASRRFDRRIALPLSVLIVAVEGK